MGTPRNGRILVKLVEENNSPLYLQEKKPKAEVLEIDPLETKFAKVGDIVLYNANMPTIQVDSSKENEFLIREADIFYIFE